MNRTRVGTAVVVALSLSLSLGAALAGPAADKHPELDKLKGNDQVVQVYFKQQELGQAFDMLEKMGAITFSYGEGFPSHKKISGKIDGTLKEVLSKLAEEQGLAYEVPKEDTLIIKGAAAKP